MKLLLDKKDVRDFAFTNQDAMLLINQATDDYLSARCLILNNLFPGLVLAAQAVEKYLKGFILLSDNTKKARDYNHDLSVLFNEVKKINQLSWDEYDELIARLKSHYQSRYPDNKNGSTSKSTAELLEIDRLVISLVEQLPMPDEVKYKSGLYVHVNNLNFPGAQWAIQQNEALNLNEINQRYSEVMTHLNKQIN